jgi:hypothetical protein
MDNLFGVAAKWKEDKDIRQSAISVQTEASLTAPSRMHNSSLMETTVSDNGKRNKNNIMYISSPMETPKSDDKKRNENNIMYISSPIDVTKRTSSKRQNVQAITEITHKNTTTLSPSVPSSDSETRTLEQPHQEKEREFYLQEDRSKIIEKAKSVFKVDSTIAKIDIPKLDYLLYLVETGQKDPGSIRHLYAYCKSLVIPDSFPRFNERHRPVQTKKDYSRESFNNDHSRSQEYTLVNVLKSLYPRVDVEDEIQKIRDGNVAYPDSPDDALQFLTAWMAKVKERNEMAAKEAFDQIRKILN